MKKKGFTLIELLAVIVVLAVIALITTPVILGVIEKAKKGAFKNSVYGLIESTNIYIAENLDADNISFICNGKDCITENDNKLSFKGNVPKSGSIKVDKQHIEVEYITDGTYCAYGTLEDLIIDKGCANIDITKPVIDESKLIISSTTSSISIRILEGFAIDPESGVKEYRVTLNGETKTLKEIGSLTFEGLEKNRLYPIKIEVENGKGLIVEVKKESSTLDFENPTITLTNTPTTAVNGYLKSQVAKVTYNSTNISSPQYYVKTTRVGTSSVAVTKTCGAGTIPSTCTSVTSTTTLSANTWYQISGNVNVTYSTAASETATIYAITYDGTNYSGAATGTISKIDTTSPTVTVGTVTAKTNNLVINYTIADSESGVNTPTCKYGTTSGTYDKTGVATTTTCTMRGLTANKTYYYQICVSDKVGNSTCKTGSSASASMINPSITLINTPTTAVNGYLKSQVAKVTYNSTNITSPQYYVKTTRVGTSSVAVTKTCGTGTTPSTCTSVTSTTTLSANTWYQISGNVNVTYNKTATSTANIYAITYDGKNYSGSASGTVSKIDATSPTIGTISFSSVDCHNFTTNLTVTDANSGLSKIVWYYKLSSDNSYSNITDTYTTYNGSSIGTTSSVTKQRTFTFGSYNKTYNVYARVYDVSGNYKDTAVVNVTTKAPVATIGSTGYSSVSNAVSASSNGNTIVLQKNTSETITIPSGKSISINLNSKTLSSTSTYTTLVNNGILKVYGGTIENSASSTTGKAIINQGNLTITSGTYRSNKSGDQSLWNASGATSNLNGGTFSNSLALPVANEGTMNINGATITGSQGLGQYASTAVINFNSGTVTANSSDGVIIMAGQFYMYGGTVIGNNSGIWIPSNGSGTIIMAGGSVTGNNYDGISKQGSGNIYIGNNSTCPTKIQGHNWGIYSPGGGLEFRCSTNLIGGSGAYYVGS